MKKLGIEIDSEEEKEIIENLYVLRNQIKAKDFDKTNYSKQFLEKIKEIIIVSDNIQNKIIKTMIENLFQDLDRLFKPDSIKDLNLIETDFFEKLEKYKSFKNSIISNINSFK